MLTVFLAEGEFVLGTDVFSGATFRADRTSPPSLVVKGQEQKGCLYIFVAVNRFRPVCF